MDRVGAIAPTLSIWSFPALIVAMAFRFETANERWSHYRESVAEHPFYSPSEYNYSDSEYEALMGHGQARNPRGPINTIEMEQNAIVPGGRVDSPTTINMRKHIPMAQQLFDQGFDRDQIQRELIGVGLTPAEAAAVTQRFYLDNPYTRFEGERKEQERKQKRRETANDHSKQSIAEADPFLDPSELTNPAVAEQHQQNYAELKQKVTELYNGFMSGQIGADVFARELNNAVRSYSDKPVQY